MEREPITVESIHRELDRRKKAKEGSELARGIDQAARASGGIAKFFMGFVLGLSKGNDSRY